MAAIFSIDNRAKLNWLVELWKWSILMSTKCGGKPCSVIDRLYKRLLDRKKPMGS
jgi:hypothetical protein